MDMLDMHCWPNMTRWDLLAPGGLILRGIHVGREMACSFIGVLPAVHSVLATNMVGTYCRWPQEDASG